MNGSHTERVHKRAETERAAGREDLIESIPSIHEKRIKFYSCTHVVLIIVLLPFYSMSQSFFRHIYEPNLYNNIGTLTRQPSIVSEEYRAILNERRLETITSPNESFFDESTSSASRDPDHDLLRSHKMRKQRSVTDLSSADHSVASSSSSVHSLDLFEEHTVFYGPKKLAKNEHHTHVHVRHATVVEVHDTPLSSDSSPSPSSSS